MQQHTTALLALGWLLVVHVASQVVVGAAVAAQQQEGLQLHAARSLQQQPDGTIGLLLPLSAGHGAHWAHGRRLHKLGALAPVLGAVKEGYFYAQLSIGTPARTYSTIIDTGSTITYIPCSRCQHCGTHMDATFDPDQSSTARWLGCGDAGCQCGSPACSCREDTCYYTRHYAEDSSSEGWMVADKLHLAAVSGDGHGGSGAAAGGSTTTSSNSSSSSSSSPPSSSSVDIVFGCENAETGEIYKQRVDGVLGMGNNVNALPRQLARSGQLRDVFSLCYGFPEGGAMLLGAVATQPRVSLAYTPLLSTPNNYYTIRTLGLSLGGKRLAVPQADYAAGYGTVLDSGTTFTYLPTSAYRAFLAALKEALRHTALVQVAGADPSFNDVCWRNAPANWEGLERLFPAGNITFAGGVGIQLRPQRYLFAVDAPGTYCLGMFDNGRSGTLLGGIITRNVLVEYDKERDRVGMGEADCNSIKAALPAAAGAAGSSAAASESSGKAADAPALPGQPPASPQEQQEGQPGAGADGAATSSDGVVAGLPAGQDGGGQATGAGAQAAAAGHGAAPPAAAKQQAAGGADAADGSGSSSSSSSFGWQGIRAASPAVLWLGLAVAGVVVLVIVQLAYVTCRQRPGGGKGGGGGGGGGAAASSGTLLPLSFAGAPAPRRAYQQLGVADDEQELVDLSLQRQQAQQLGQQQAQQQAQQQQEHGHGRHQQQPASQQGEEQEGGEGLPMLQLQQGASDEQLL